MEQTPNGVLLVDKHTRIRYVNPTFQDMFHCAGEEIMDNKAAVFVHSDCFERAIAAGGRLLAKETIPKHNVSYRVGLFPIEGQDLYCGIFIDISEERRSKEALQGVAGSNAAEGSGGDLPSDEDGPGNRSPVGRNDGGNQGPAVQVDVSVRGRGVVARLDAR